MFRFSARIRPEPQSTTTESWEHRCMEHFKRGPEQHRSRLQPTGPAWNFQLLKRKARSTRSIAAPAKPLGPNTYAHRLAEHFKKRSGTNPAPLPTHRTSQKPAMTAAESSGSTVDRSTNGNVRVKHLRAPSDGTLSKRCAEQHRLCFQRTGLARARNGCSGKLGQHGRSEHLRNLSGQTLPRTVGRNPFEKMPGVSPALLPTHWTRQVPEMTAAENWGSTLDRSTRKTFRVKHLRAPSDGTP